MNNYTTAPQISIVGAGKVGTALALALHQRGIRIAAVHSLDVDAAVVLSQQVNAAAVGTPHDAAQVADLTLLTVPDDIIESVALALANRDWTGKAFVHTSGAHSLHSLDALQARGAWVGSLHPAMPFADAHIAAQRLAGATFAIEASHPALRAWLEHIVARLEGRPLWLMPDQKALYHAALVIASNYTVTLYALAERLLQSIGAAQPTIDSALYPLLAATVENIHARGIPDALTGPLVREDIGTVHAHLDALHTHDPQLAQAYRMLARLTYPLLQMRGINTEHLDIQLNPQDKADANHNS